MSPSVVHVGQAHRSANSSPEEQETTIDSQIEIMKYIRKELKRNGANRVAVLLEGEPHHLTESCRQKGFLAEEAKRAFPNGRLPKDLSQLTPDQRCFIYTWGGARTLYLMGELDSIYPTTTGKSNDATVQASRYAAGLDSSQLRCLIGNSIDFHSLLFSNREKNAKDAVTALPPKYKEALIVYGAAHDFRDEFKGYKFKTVDLSMMSAREKARLAIPLAPKPPYKSLEEAFKYCSIPEIP